MAVFTPVSLADLSAWLVDFPLGEAVAIRGISSGIENSNFFITTTTGEYVLTVFEKLSFEQLPFYVNLMRHLSQRGVRVPAPIANNRGEIINALHGKPATIVTKLVGECQLSPQPVHCAEVGRMLAKMHLAGQDFEMTQPNLRGLDWWLETEPLVRPYLDADKRELLHEEILYQKDFAESATYGRLARGPVHADLFRNNVMFDDEQLTGFFDFYFAGCDSWLFDVAVTINDWCIDLDTGVFDMARVRAMLDAYHSVRPFTEDEQTAWPVMLRAGALRFWVSRLYDFYLPRDAEMLTPHDPGHFERILRERIAHPAPQLFNHA